MKGYNYFIVKPLDSENVVSVEGIRIVKAVNSDHAKDLYSKHLNVLTYYDIQLATFEDIVEYKKLQISFDEVPEINSDRRYAIELKSVDDHTELTGKKIPYSEIKVDSVYAIYEKDGTFVCKILALSKNVTLEPNNSMVNAKVLK